MATKNKKIGSFIKIGLSIVMVILILLGFYSMIQNDKKYADTGVVIKESPIKEKPSNYGEAGLVKVSENNTLILYADKTTGEIAVEEKANGKVWYSNPQDRDADTISTVKPRLSSQLVVNCFVVNSQQSTVVDNVVGSIKKGGMEYKEIENGVRFTFSFPMQGIVIPIEYKISEKGFSAEIMYDEVQELFSSKYLINEIALLPFFGAGSLNDDGYMFVPDGSGAIIDFNNGKQAYPEYSQIVYGRDLSIPITQDVSVTENIHLPVFGAKVNQNAFLGVISSGDNSSRINASVSRKTSSYNQVYSSLIFRQSELSTGDGKGKGSFVNIKYMNNFEKGSSYKIDFHFLNGNDANYSGMARKYKDVLNQAQALNNSVFADKNSMVVELYGAVRVPKQILGVNVNKTIPLTTYNQVCEIVDKLVASGIDDIVINYKGAINDGYNQKITSQVNPIDELGGKKDFVNMINHLEKLNVKLFIDADINNIYKNGNGYSASKSCAKNVFDSPIFQYRYNLNNYKPSKKDRWWLLNPKLFSEVSESLVDSAEKIGVNNISLSGIGNSAYSNFDKNNYVTRAENHALVNDAVGNMKKSINSILMSGGNQNALMHSDIITDISVDSSNYEILDRTVPFYSMVLSGDIAMSTSAVNMTPDANMMLLKALENGVNIKYTWIASNISEIKESNFNYLIGTDIEMWLDTATKTYLEFDKVMSQVAGEQIINHEFIKDGVTMTEYKNGKKVYVNYTSNSVSIGSDAVAPKGYIIKG